MMVEAEAVKSPIAASGELSQRMALLLRGPGSPAVVSGNGGAAGKIRGGPPASGASSAGRAPEPAAPAIPQSLPPAQEAPKAKPKRAPRKTKKKAEMPPPPAAAFDSHEQAADGESVLSVYQITLLPGPDVLRRGVNPLGVLDELRELGETTITTDPDLVPPLEQLDPERCYLTWTIQVRTAAAPGSNLRGVSLLCRG